MKTVIFDMDGVIIDSEPLHFMVDKIILKKLNINSPDNYLDQFVGFTNPAMWEVIKNEYSVKESIDELIDLQMSIKLKQLEENDYFPIDGITELLKSLAEKNYKAGIASSSPRIFIEAVIKKLKIENYFFKIVSGEEVPKSKPEPDVFLTTAKQLEAKPNSCVVIEDSKSGVAAAKKAGMKCIGFQNPSSGNQDLSSADIIVHSIADIKYSTIENLLKDN